MLFDLSHAIIATAAGWRLAPVAPLADEPQALSSPLSDELLGL